MLVAPSNGVAGSIAVGVFDKFPLLPESLEVLWMGTGSETAAMSNFAFTASKQDIRQNEARM